jgi:hypothetical protein
MEQCSKVQKNQHRLRRDTCTVASEHPKLYSIIGGGTCCNNATKYKKELNQLPITISVRKKNRERTQFKLLQSRTSETRHWLGVDTHNYQEIDHHVRARIFGNKSKQLLDNFLIYALFVSK